MLTSSLKRWPCQMTSMPMCAKVWLVEGEGTMALLIKVLPGEIATPWTLAMPLGGEKGAHLISHNVPCCWNNSLQTICKIWFQTNWIMQFWQSPFKVYSSVGFAARKICEALGHNDLHSGSSHYLSFFPYLAPQAPRRGFSVQCLKYSWKYLQDVWETRREIH